MADFELVLTVTEQILVFRATKAIQAPKKTFSIYLVDTVAALSFSCRNVLSEAEVWDSKETQLKRVMPHTELNDVCDGCTHEHAMTVKVNSSLFLLTKNSINEREKANFSSKLQRVNCFEKLNARVFTRRTQGMLMHTLFNWLFVLQRNPMGYWPSVIAGYWPSSFLHVYGSRRSQGL